jgi:O-methyltransferase
MGLVESLKRPLKKSYAIHSAYKLARDFGQIPKGKLTRFDALQDIAKILPNTMLKMPRLFDLFDLVKQINEDMTPGALVECGVWNGGAVGLMGLANRRFPGPQRKMHLFDSFEGLPQPTENDKDVYSGYLQQVAEGTKPSAEELIAIGACRGLDRPKVEEFLVSRLGLARNELVFHVGWFQDTVPAARDSIGAIALLRLDGDWYDSTKVCIENLYDNVVSEGFVVIDDYGAFKGCAKAIDEFFAVRGIKPEIVASDEHCIYFRKT